MTFLETERLILRNVKSADAEIMYDYRNNDVCARYQRDQVKDRQGIDALVQRRAEDRLGIDAPCLLAVALKDSDHMVGEIVVMPNDGAISLGYTFHYEHHRKGYAFEALSALTEMLHQAHPKWDFICFTETENEASMALLRKLGYKDMGYIPQLDSQMFGKWTEEFRKPEVGDVSEITAFKQEFLEDGSSMDGTGFLRRYNAEEWLRSNREMETVEDDVLVPSLQYGLFCKEDGRLLGLLQIRLELKGYLTDFGGHIGYCVRPSQRRKGYAKQMLADALEICRQKGLKRVLITCLEVNAGSERTILACGGKYEKTVYDEKNYKANIKRYWIEL